MMPWSTNPDFQPKSHAMPNLKTFYNRIHIRGSDSIYEDVFPYQLDDSNSIAYYEFRGDGPPPSDLKPLEGAIYLNRSGREVFAFVRNAWVEWKGLPPSWKSWPSSQDRINCLIAHPYVKNRWLWVTKSFLLWHSADGITRTLHPSSRERSGLNWPPTPLRDLLSSVISQNLDPNPGRKLQPLVEEFAASGAQNAQLKPGQKRKQRVGDEHNAFG